MSHESLFVFLGLQQSEHVCCIVLFVKEVVSC